MNFPKSSWSCFHCHDKLESDIRDRYGCVFQLVGIAEPFMQSIPLVHYCHFLFLEFLELFDRITPCLYIVDICIFKQSLSCFAVFFLELLHMFLQSRFQDIRTGNNSCKSILHYFSVCQIVIPQSSLGIPIFIFNFYLQESLLYVTIEAMTLCLFILFLKTISNNNGWMAEPVSKQSLKDGCSGFLLAEQSYTILSLIVFRILFDYRLM